MMKVKVLPGMFSELYSLMSTRVRTSDSGQAKVVSITLRVYLNKKTMLQRVKEFSEDSQRN